MGNICGKADSDHFSSPGRTVGSAPAPGPKSAPVPKKATVGGPGRTLGGSGSSGAGSDSRAATAAAAASSVPPDEARRRAAEAAEARAASANKPGGKLKAQLAVQKKQTRNDTLNEVSRQGLQGKEPDYADPRNWD